MKALITITGRGIGGDTVTALNIAKSLEKRGVKCEYALDHKAPGFLFRKMNIKWHKVTIPQAGGHAATKMRIIRAALLSIKGVAETWHLIKKINPDVVVGVIGGGAIIGCTAAKLARVPAVGILITPLDGMICTKLNPCIALPESNLYFEKRKNLYKSYSPIDPEIIKGSYERAIKRMPSGFKENKKTILFSSGSSLFEKMAIAAEKISKLLSDYNIVVTGHPLSNDILKHLNNTIYLGYVDWMKDLYKIVDLAILSDDGVMVHEAIACKIPTVALKGVKYGREHNMAKVFPDAVIESYVNEIEMKVEEALSKLDSMKKAASKYSKEILRAGDKIADIILNHVKKGKN